MPKALLDNNACSRHRQKGTERKNFRNPSKIFFVSFHSIHNTVRHLSSTHVLLYTYSTFSVKTNATKLASHIKPHCATHTQKVPSSIQAAATFFNCWVNVIRKRSWRFREQVLVLAVIFVRVQMHHGPWARRGEHTHTTHLSRFIHTGPGPTYFLFLSFFFFLFSFFVFFNFDILWHLQEEK